MSRSKLAVLFLVAGATQGCGERVESNRLEQGLLGPLVMETAAGKIESVELDIEFVSLETGSFSGRLCYDADADGQFDAMVPIEPHLAHWNGGTLPERWSCPQTLDGTYRFRFDREEQGLTEDETAALRIFVGMKSGGCFYLEARDGAADATSSVRSWSVSTRCAQ
jgi:hypothetical protein